MSEQPDHKGTSTFKAALDRLTGGSLALFEYLLAVGTIAVLILSMQTEISTLAAVIAAVWGGFLTVRNWHRVKRKGYQPRLHCRYIWQNCCRLSITFVGATAYRVR